MCPNAPQCFLLFPQFGGDDQQYDTLDTVLKTFSLYSTAATSAKRQAFLARNPLVARLKSNIAFADQKDVSIEVKMLAESYVNVPAATGGSEPPPAYESRSELKVLYGLLRRFKAMNESEIADGNDAFRSMMNQAFNA